MVARARKYFTSVSRELLTECGEEELEIDVVYTRSRYYPAQLYGPAENCHPAEGGEVEILSALDQFGQEHELTSAEIDQVDANLGDVEWDDCDE